MIKIANKHHKPILIDPKGVDYSKYKNATIITPNKQELAAVIGAWSSEEDLHQKAMQLQNNLHLPYLLLTRSEEGMTLFTGQNHPASYPTLAREVFDVSGAGDTVIGTLGIMLANNMNISQAALLANIAAGIVVGKLGTATANKIELLERCYESTQIK